MPLKTIRVDKRFNEGRESQDQYCKGCLCICNVALIDGETCGDRIEFSPQNSLDNRKRFAERKEIF
jgi:hypothetical protein